MFQSFEVTASAAHGKERVAALRERFDPLKIDAFLVPRADRYQGEYVPASEARLAWLTGFTGSAGIALVLRPSAHVFVDGRYTTQVRQQVDLDVFTPQDLIKEPPSAWLRSNGGKGLRIGVDPWLHTVADMRRLEETAEQIGGSIVRLPDNPLDALWTDRPSEPVGPVSVQPERNAGRTAPEKLSEIDKALKKNGADACVLTDPSSIAWVFNIRGSDVPHTPHPLSMAILSRSGRPRLFIDAQKLGDDATVHLEPLADIHAPDELEETIIALAKDKLGIMVDPGLTAARIGDLIVENGGRLIEKPDPARLPRAEKNSAELDGSRAAHRRDGAAMVSFLAWLDEQQPGTIDEIAAVKALEQARRSTGEGQQMPLRDISFETISGAGAHGAIIHYRVTNETSRPLQAGELYLVDSGGQYQDGTTDITRTVPIGSVGQEEKRFFTLVLRGMIALTLQRFPEGTRGADIDVIARAALWNAGADYGHGTGHGVGSYLSVHEGPQSISRRGVQELKPWMILSNEPGYYREGAFGIRIENLVIVREAEAIDGGDKPMLGFETLTLCPIDRRLILPELLQDRELDWLNAYHQRVRTELEPLLTNQAEKEWLTEKTAPIGR